MTIQKDGSENLQARALELAHELNVFRRRYPAVDQSDIPYFTALHEKAWLALQNADFEHRNEDSYKAKVALVERVLDLNELIQICTLMLIPKKSEAYESARASYEKVLKDRHPKDPDAYREPQPAQDRRPNSVSGHHPFLEQEEERLRIDEEELRRQERDLQREARELQREENEKQRERIRRIRQYTESHREFRMDNPGTRKHRSSEAASLYRGLGLPSIDDLIAGTSRYNLQVAPEAGLKITLAGGDLYFGTTHNDGIMIDVHAKSVERWSNGVTNIDHVTGGEIYLPSECYPLEVLVSGSGNVGGELSFTGSIHLRGGTIDAALVKPVRLYLPDTQLRQELCTNSFPDLGNGYRGVRGFFPSADAVLVLDAFILKLGYGVRFQ